MCTMNVDEKIGGSPEALRFGPLVLEGRALLAPLSGVTDVVFRRIARRFGASLVVSEMVASDDYVNGSAEATLRAEGQGVDPHVVQLAGCDAGWMARAAALAERSGAALVDVNMGCPAKRVTGGWAGSALMRDLDHATGLVRAVLGAVSVPVTVKMRLGWDAASLVAPDLARRLEDLGVAAVTVRSSRVFQRHSLATFSGNSHYLFRHVLSPFRPLHDRFVLRVLECARARTIHRRGRLLLRLPPPNKHKAPSLQPADNQS